MAQTESDPVFASGRNRLFRGDNLEILRTSIPDAVADLIYLDPPFNSNSVYVLKQPHQKSQNAGESNRGFPDVWRWNEQSQDQFDALVTGCDEKLSQLLRCIRSVVGCNGILAYVTMMTPRLQELHRVLKPTGSIYLHCDSNAAHYLRLMMDVIFGADNFLNHIVWCYGLGGSTRRRWPRKHDDILWYSRTPDGHYFDADKIPATSARMAGRDKKAPDYWLIPTLNNMAKERCGYPTQKPEALLERIIRSSSREGELVLDPFCGSGTTLVVAERLGRSWVGIDINPAAVQTAGERLSIINGD